MANDVKVVIELTKASGKIGFGYPLILAANESKAIAYTEVRSLTEIVNAGFTAGSDVYKAAQILFMQNDAPGKIAVCGATGTAVEALPGLLGEGWRQLIVTDHEEETVTAVSNYIEACGKYCMYFTVGEAGASANERTVMIAYDDGAIFPEAALVGATAGMDAGSFTYKNIILKGVTAQAYTDSEVAALHEKGVITILRKAGDIVTSEGITLSKEYADIVDTKDWIIEQIAFRGQSLMNRVPKLPYDNRGIAALEGETVSALKVAADMGMIAVTDDGTYDYSVNFASRAECDANDITARHYNGGQFRFVLAGAIHEAEITGEVIA